MNIALVYSTDWTEIVKVVLYSIFRNHTTPVKVYLISDKEGDFDTSHITSHFKHIHNTEFIDAQEIYERRITSTVNVDSRFTKYTLYRLLLPELINDDRLLYMDTDAVVNGDLYELYHLDLENKLIAGVSDIGADYYNLKKPLGLKPSDIYINAGIMLMDLKGIRETKLQDMWVYEANTNYYRFHDQCILNKTVQGKIKLISNQYNCSVSTGLDVSEDKIKIMHYVGNKPWNNVKVPNARIWFHAVSEYKRIQSRNTSAKYSE